MKLLKNVLMLTVAGTALAACAECPKMEDYNNVPYARERTAGEGVAVYDSRCRVERPVAREETVVETRREPVTRAEPVFSETQRK